MPHSPYEYADDASWLYASISLLGYMCGWGPILTANSLRLVMARAGILLQFL